MKIIYLLIFISAINVQAQTQKIEFEAAASYPEGIAYDANRNVFYVSSVTTGTIGKLDPSGKYSILHQDNRFKSSFGMKVTPDGKTIWVCVGDPNYSKYKDSTTFRKMARLISIDTKNGKKIKDINLATLYPGKQFPNDLTLDNKGNIYITNSFSPVIYQVDASGKATVYAENELFKAVGVGLNGIAWHPKGFLLVVNNSNGVILKVAGTTVQKVKVNQFFPGADGLLLDKQQNLVLVQNKGVNKVFRLASQDDWSSAIVTGATAASDNFSYPSTATFKKDEIWVMNAKLNELSDSNTVISKKFTIQRADLK